MARVDCYRVKTGASEAVKIQERESRLYSIQAVVSHHSRYEDMNYANILSYCDRLRLEQGRQILSALHRLASAAFNAKTRTIMNFFAMPTACLQQAADSSTWGYVRVESFKSGEPRFTSRGAMGTSSYSKGNKNVHVAPSRYKWRSSRTRNEVVIRGSVSASGFVENSLEITSANLSRLVRPHQSLPHPNYILIHSVMAPTIDSSLLLGFETSLELAKGRWLIFDRFSRLWWLDPPLLSFCPSRNLNSSVHCPIPSSHHASDIEY